MKRAGANLRRRRTGRATEADLRALQRRMLQALVQPLTADDALAPTRADGRPMAEVAAEFIKPNDRLTAFERLQIYARSYWSRLIDCVHDDAPGLRALLGEERFAALVRAYLAKYPSRSFTLRNLTARLAQFIGEAPRWTRPHTALAQAVARFEWAQTVAFDGEARPVLRTEDLARTKPETLRLGLQPYLSLIAAAWPVDDYVLAVKRREGRSGQTSNTAEHGASAAQGAKPRRVPRPRRRRTWVVVHRHGNRIYYKRVEPAAFRVLAALAAGRTLAEALAAAGPRVRPARVRAWFEGWMALGWLCRAERPRRARLSSVVRK